MFPKDLLSSEGRPRERVGTLSERDAPFLALELAAPTATGRHGPPTRVRRVRCASHNAYAGTLITMASTFYLRDTVRRRGACLGGRDTGQSIRFFRRGNECPSHFPVRHSHASRPDFLHSAGDTECSIFGPASKVVRTRKREGHSSCGGWQSMDCWHCGG